MWSAGSVGIFYIGPLASGIPNSVSLLWFMALVLLSFAVGYLIGRRLVLGQSVSSAPLMAYRSRPSRVVLLSATWILLYSFSSLIAIGVDSPARLIEAISTPRLSYLSKFASLEGVGGGLFQVLNVLGAFYFLLVPYLCLYWRTLRVALRIYAILAMGCYISFYLAVGTQRGVGDITLMLVVCVFAIRSASRRKHVGAAFRGTLWVRVLMVLVVVAAAATVVWSLGQRSDATSSWLTNVPAQQQLAQLSPILGPVGARGVVTLASYVSQGYYGMSLALRLPWIPTGGLGAFPALSSYLPQYFGIEDPHAWTYPVRVQEAFGWSSTASWSTVYPWFASDISFVGVVILAGIFGAFLAYAWCRFLLRQDGLRLTVIVLAALVIIYSPANNQLFNDRFAAIGTLTLMAVYLFRGIGRWMSSERHGGKRGVASLSLTSNPGELV